jgi:hypothetical protein
MRTKLLLTALLSVLGCTSPSPTSSQEQALIAQGCSVNAPDPRACDPTDTKKTTVCHIPPGNPANAHTICVGNAAVPAHLDHGDFVGTCACGSDDVDAGVSTGSDGSDGSDGSASTGSGSGSATLQ